MAGDAVAVEARARALARLAAAYAVDLTEARALVYLEALADVPPDDLARGVAALVATWVPPPGRTGAARLPMVAEIRAACGAVPPDALALLGALRRAKAAPGSTLRPPALPAGVAVLVERLGGWAAVMDLPETVEHRRVVDAYPAIVAACGRRGVGLLEAPPAVPALPAPPAPAGGRDVAALVDSVVRAATAPPPRPAARRRRRG